MPERLRMVDSFIDGEENGGVMKRGEGGKDRGTKKVERRRGGPREERTTQGESNNTGRSRIKRIEEEGGRARVKRGRAGRTRGGSHEKREHRNKNHQKRK